MRIYIAGPYTADTTDGKLENTNKAIDIGIQLYKKGHFPYIPHLTHWVDVRAEQTNIDLMWEDYIKWDLEWLDLCDALLYIGKSKGADIELEFAKKKGKIIFYSLDEIVNSCEIR
jgi:hypothetical protein